MKNGIRFLLVAAGLAVSSANAFADGSVKDVAGDVRTCSGGAFAGLYVGASVGYARHEDDKTDLNFGTSFGGDAGSLAGSLFYGHNWQCGRFVFGVESDIGIFDAEISQIDPGGGVGTTTLRSEIDWFSTSRIRLGLAHEDRVLFFVTGGLAYADVSHAVSNDVLAFSETHDDGQWGWTIGAGIEFLRDRGWSVRAEALYVDLGSETEVYTTCGGACEARYDWENDFWVGRIGISYKFGEREEHVPLK